MLLKHSQAPPMTPIKMSVALFNGLSDKIEVIVDEDNKPWFKRVHVGSFLEINAIFGSR